MSRLGAFLLVMGIGSFVLPMVGMQFTVLDGLATETLNFTRMGLIGGGLLLAVVGGAVEGNQ